MCALRADAQLVAFYFMFPSHSAVTTTYTKLQVFRLATMGFNDVQVTRILLFSVSVLRSDEKMFPALDTRSVNSHLPLDVVLQQVLVNGEKVIAAHVVVVVGHRVAELLAVRSVFHIIRLVAVAVVKVS